MAPRPRNDIKRRLLKVAHHAFGLTGIYEPYVRASKARGAVILMYHSVATSARAAFQDPGMVMPASVFAAQMSYLSQRRQVVSLNALAQMLAHGESPAPGTVVITFDDGYLDNYEVAAPILARYDLPATVFLATGYVERTENMWIDVIYGMFKWRTRQHLELEGAEFNLHESKDLSYAYASTARTLVRRSKADRARIMTSIQEQLQPSREAPRLVMSWTEVRALCDHYPNISIGSHTREHIDLSRLRQEEVAEELSAAHEDIRREVGVDVVHFTFPYGRYTTHARSWLQSNGYRSALLTEPMSLVRRASDPLALTRLEVQQDFSLPRLAYYTSGAHPALSHMLLLSKSRNSESSVER